MQDIKELAAALVALQADLVPVGKTAENPFFKSKYADLPSVMQAVQPLLANHKLAVSQFITNIDGQSALRTILMHESGQSIEDVMPLLLPKEDPQGQGSAITYARRYSFMAVLGVVADEDDDGNKASKPGQTSQTKPQTSPAKPASPKQLDFIRQLAHDKGFDDAAIEARLKTIKTAAEASAAIETLQEGSRS